jgi:NTE family protein
MDPMSESGSGVLQRALGALQRRPERARRINLALQGGGAHGAFTWGVLDRLLDRRELEIDGVSGTSAGAVNAVALAAGYREDGTEGARRKLATVWRALSESGCVLPVRRSAKATGAPVANSDDSPYYLAMQMLTGIFSPYDFNPLEIDPLRAILDRYIDFKDLRRNPPMTLFINATEVATGRGRVFTGKEITLEAVLASACLPALRHAVKIGRQHYWDGAFSANPALLPLIESCATADTLIVRLAPARLPELPKKASDIHGHVSRIMFSQPLRKEIELIETGRRTARQGIGLTDKLGRRLKRHRFHMVDAARYTAELGHASALTPDWDLLVYLQACGRKAMANWLGRHRGAVGRRSTVDLAAKFL